MVGYFRVSESINTCSVHLTCVLASIVLAEYFITLRSTDLQTLFFFSLELN